MPETDTVVDLANQLVDKDDRIDLLECRIQDLEAIIDAQERELSVCIPRRYDPAEYLD